MNAELISLQRHHIADVLYKSRRTLFDEGLANFDIGYSIGAAAHTYDAGRTLSQVFAITDILRKRLEVKA